MFSCLLAIVGCESNAPTVDEDPIQLPCYPANSPALKPEGNLAILQMLSNDQVHLRHEGLDTVLPLDSILHVSLFQLIEQVRYHESHVLPVLQLDNRLEFDTYVKLRAELMKAGFWKHRLQGCDYERFDVMLPPYAAEMVGYHDEQVVSRLPPQPPLPDLQSFTPDGTTVIATLLPGATQYIAGDGKPVLNLSDHILKYESVWFIYKPVAGTLYDDLFRFYSEIMNTIDSIRGPQEPDSVYLEIRRRYPMRIMRYPEGPLEWEGRIDTVDVRT